LIQQERLRALGQMASGIAHDINNAISPVALYTESLLKREPNLSVQARGQLMTIQRAIDDCAQTVARMARVFTAQARWSRPDGCRTEPAGAAGGRSHPRRWSDQPQRRGVMVELKSELAADLPNFAASTRDPRCLDQSHLQCRGRDASGGVIEVRTSLLTSGHGGTARAGWR